MNESLLQTIPFPMQIVDAHGVVLFANAPMNTMAGRDVTGDLCCCRRNVQDSQIFPEDCPLKAPIELGKTSTVESSACPGGKTFQIFHTGMSYQGTPALLEVFIDITARKQSEAEQQRLMAAIEQSDENIIITDPSGVIQYVNPAFERLTGYSRDEAIGKTPALLKSGMQDTLFYRELWQTLTHGDIWIGRFSNKRKDGTLYTEEATISPVRDAAGLTTNYVAIKRNITEHLQLEAKFQQVQKMEAIGRLAGGVAHDFNNMLQAILGYAEMAMEKVTPSNPLHADLYEILNAAQRSADLTRQLLTFARRQAVSPKQLNLNHTVENMLKMLRRLIGEDIDLVWRPGDGALNVRMDPSQADQILANLAVNARDAIDGVGKLTIETGTLSLDESACVSSRDAIPGEYVTLSVSDTGCGMDQTTLEHMFEPFFTTKHAGAGTGLGLATVYGIVKQNNGFIDVQSEPHNGTTFRIFLPAHSEPTSTPAQHAKPAPPTRGTETILLVEDERNVRLVAQTFLEEYGYKVLSVETPDTALRVAAEYRAEIHLLLIDLVMPRMGGQDLARRLRELRPSAKCLFMSGYSPDVIASRGMMDCNGHLMPKPFTRDDLAFKVREILGKH